jgi:hypothetical protein
VAREALRRLRTHLVEADDDAAGGSGGVEVLDGPLFAANAGSTRSPNQVSSLRQRSPSAMSSSSMRLRFMVMPFCSARYTAKRSSVQEAKGRPRVCGSVSAVATTVPTCSRVYVGGRPWRGLSSSPVSPPSLKRCSHRYTVAAVIWRRSAIANTRSPSRAASATRARSTRRTAAVRECASHSTVARSSAVTSRNDKVRGMRRLL